MLMLDCKVILAREPEDCLDIEVKLDESAGVGSLFQHLRGFILSVYFGSRIPMSFTKVLERGGTGL